ncbi:MAG: hypothetical protein DHS20C15_30930 [Planctomycetota bacterium]|nr:MAG: hypothetical protein DHS20C15_30930 [Planctomycetota bacterium]
MAAKRAPVPAAVVVGASGDTGFESQGISLLAWIPLSEFGGSMGADSWGYTSGSGREYAIMTTNAVVSFVEISDPGRPEIVQTFNAVQNDWRDVKVYQDHAYWVSEGGDNVQIADLSQIDNGTVTFVGSVGDSGTSATHNLAIDEDSGFLYRLGGGSNPTEGMRVFSLANPASPTFVGEWNDRYIHDAQVVRYTSGPFANQQIAFVFSEETSGGGAPGVDILNVTNKNNITKISDAFYGSAVFSHQGWLSPDRNTLYLNDELDETSFGTLTTTRVLNVSNLNNPQVVNTFTSGKTSIDHNLYTKDNLIFEANYRSGLRVFDATNPTSPVETAFFDTYPSDDAASFNGLWNVFPYFDSDTVIGSDIERGLFIWRMGDRELDISVTGSAPELIDPNGESLFVDIVAQGGAALDISSVRLHLDTGSGFVESPLANLGGGSFRADFPALDCGAEVTYYFSARTMDGVTWSEPAAGPSFVFGAVAANTQTTVFDEDLESAPGWTVGAPGDSASTGVWERVDPIGTGAQPDDDHTDGGTLAYVTGQGPVFGGLGDNDVDGGDTTLTTSDYDLSDGDATISYWRWYSNTAGGSPNEDSFVVDISNNGGGSWTNVEVVGPTGDETSGGWFQHSFVVSDLVTPTANVRLRFIASDFGGGSIVEAAVDDLRVDRFDCNTCQADLGFGGPGSAVFSVCGQPLDSGNSALALLENAPPSAPAFLFLGLANNPTSFHGGQLVPLPFVSLTMLSTNPAGKISVNVPGGNGPVTVYAQFAIADGSQPNGAALSNALELQFGP